MKAIPINRIEVRKSPTGLLRDRCISRWRFPLRMIMAI